MTNYKDIFGNMDTIQAISSPFGRQLTISNGDFTISVSDADFGDRKVEVKSTGVVGIRSWDNAIDYDLVLPNNTVVEVDHIDQFMAAYRNASPELRMELVAAYDIAVKAKMLYECWEDITDDPDFQYLFQPAVDAA